MLNNETLIGASQTGTSFADIIINNDNAVADGLISGFAQFVHDPKYIADTVNVFNRQNIPTRFSEAVILRRIETQQLDNIWNFPLNLSCPNTIPLPWTIVDAVERQGSQYRHEYNIMRIIDFVGRNYVRLVLPSISTKGLVPNNSKPHWQRKPEFVYVGAWHRDLIPRIIKNVQFFARSNTHKLFCYEGTDIFVHNILFGNAQKQMNDLMAGEDMFELCYDPYRVHGSALGIASYRGIDNISKYSTDYSATKGGKFNWLKVNGSGSGGYGQDGFVDQFQLDTYMTSEQAMEVYAKNVWYEHPIAKNYGWAHSIHSRRVVHASKVITFPLDILPFGYSIASSLPTAALAGDCGFISVNIYEDWFDRSFYLVSLKDIPTLYPIVNHTHYEVGDLLEFPQGNSGTPGNKITGSNAFKPILGWVNPLSIGKYGDATFFNKFRGVSGTGGPANTASLEDYEETKTLTNPNGLVNGPDASKLEGLIYTVNEPTTATAGQFQGYGNYPGMVYGTDGTATNPAFGTTLNAEEENLFDDNNTSSTFLDFGYGANAGDIKSFLMAGSIARCPSKVTDKSTWVKNASTSLGVKLLQVGYQTLPCVREFLVKLPNIYITTEWGSTDYGLQNQQFNINNDLYIQAILFWIMPVDSNGITSMRVYPCHTINHEIPLIPGIRMMNEQAQGNTIYTWDILNLTTPHLLGLPNPLLDNMGLIAFTSQLTSNKLCLAYYDSNISGYLKFSILKGNSSNAIDRSNTCFNMKAGQLKAISIGINGIASVNLNLFRLIF